MAGEAIGPTTQIAGYSDDEIYAAGVNVSNLAANHAAHKIAVICGQDHQTYGELNSQIAIGRTALSRRLAVGSNVVVFGDSSISFIETVFAALSAGLGVVPLHPRHPQAEIEHALRLARPGLIITTDEGAAAMAEHLSADHVAASTLFGEASGVTVEPVADVAADHPALLIFTSGTAGSPRIAVLSHGNVASSIEHSLASAEQLALDQQIVLGVIPLTHVLGIVSVVAVTLAAGATLVLAKSVDVDTVINTIAANDVSFVVAPPVFWYRLTVSDADPALLDSVRLALSGAAPLSGSIAAALADRFDITIRQGYGLTEASPGLTSSVGTEAPPTSVGRPLPGVRLRLVDEFGDDALVGDVGEVWAKGDNVFVGYLGDPDATALVIDDEGWLHTGDLAVVDDNGFLFIVGRNKDQLIVSGFNVHPGEVEDRLAEHHSVAAAAVIGEPDREYGETIVAYVVGAAGMTPDPDVLEAHCRTRLAGYKVPARFEFVEELPRGLTGKVRRRVLRGG